MPSTEDLQAISEKGQKVYEKIRFQYEPSENGKYLAIEPETEEVFLGNTGVEATELAKKKYPDKIFYLIKIGFESVESIASLYRN